MQIDRVDTGKAVAETDFEKNIEKSFQRLMDQLVQILTKGLKFEDNFNCFIGSLTTSAVAGTELEISHGLKRIPSGYLVIGKDKTGDIFDGSTVWTSSSIYVKSDVASLTIKVLVF